MTINYVSAYKYPYSKLLGARPCGNIPTKPEWIQSGANPNIPLYKNAPNENCSRNSCTPHLRFKDGDNDLAISRKELRQANNRAWMNNNHINTNPNSAMYSPANNLMHMKKVPSRVGSLTPFRKLMNAGDPANTHNEPIAGPKAHEYNNFDSLYTKSINQVSSTRHSSNASAISSSSRTPTTNNTEGALWTGNNKWVYDGADYVRFKKLQAKNRNYNDISWGGDRSNASQIALARVRH